MPAAGFTRSKKLKVKSYEREFTMPNKAGSLLIRNSGNIDIRIRFDDDTALDFYTVKAQQELPVLTVEGGKTTMKFKALCEEGELELLIWG